MSNCNIFKLKKYFVLLLYKIFIGVVATLKKNKKIVKSFKIIKSFQDYNFHYFYIKHVQ